MPIATINGVKLHYHVKGEGTPLILITPPLLTRAIFHYQTAELSDEFKVVTFDIRGHGMSDHSEAPLTYALISEDIKQLMDELELPGALIGGYSTGAAIALEAMLAYPDRFYGGVLLSCMSEMSDLYNRARLSLAIASCRLRAKKLLAYAICRGNADSKTTFENLYREAMHGHMDNWGQYYDACSTYNSTQQLRFIHSPMLLMYGKHDHSFYRYARILQRELLDTNLVVVKGASHQLPTKAGRAVNEVIRSWARERVPEHKKHRVKEKAAIPEPLLIDATRQQEQDYDSMQH